MQAVINLECKGKTALMLAAQGGHTETVKILIEAGADVTSKKCVRTDFVAYYVADQNVHVIR